MLSAPETEAVLVLHCPTAVATGAETARAAVTAAATTQKPVLTAWLGGEDARRGAGGVRGSGHSHL